MTQSTLNYISAALLLLSLATGCEQNNDIKRSANVIPYPLALKLQQGYVDLSRGFKLENNAESIYQLQKVLNEEFLLLTGIENDISSQDASLIEVIINANLDKEEYQLQIEDKIKITGGSYQALTMATTSMWQLMNDQGHVPKVKISDQPSFGYRAVMIDCARQWHSINTLKQIITLARYYKANYVHLHLTDDQLFTFQSKAYPQLATKGYSYTSEELIELNHYAHQRGIILIPEIDVPGHASQFVNKAPELFGIADLSANSYTMSMAKEEGYVALETIIGELAAIFTHSPYIHIGGDEAHFAGMENDPETKAYMVQKGFTNVHDLFRHFIIRMNVMVKRQGKQTMVWAGFAREGKVEIPKDIIVVSWESQYYDPQLLVEDGYNVINASFKPLYVVNNRTWKPSYIYSNWSPYKWEEGTNFDSTFAGLEVPTSDRVLGGSLCTWEQSQLVEVPRLSQRLAMMIEVLWGTATDDYNQVENRLTATEKKFQCLLFPFDITTSGTYIQEANESNFLEHLWFDDKVEITINPRIANLKINYQLITNGDTITGDVTQLKKLSITQSSKIYISATDSKNQQVGHTYYSEYFLHPITATKRGLEKEILASSWNKSRFAQKVTVELTSNMAGDIYYTTKHNGESKLYTTPLSFDKTTHLTATLKDKQGNRIGKPLRESYYQLINKECLTTGKDIIASNERIRPGKAKSVNNGRVSLWEHWSDTKNGNNWIEVDLDEVTSVTAYHVHFFWDGYRYYQYDIATSIDGKTWNIVVDKSQSSEITTISGHQHITPPHEARYLRLNIHHNSANPGLHVTEFCAY